MTWAVFWKIYGKGTGKRTARAKEAFTNRMGLIIGTLSRNVRKVWRRA
jgi:hypothetical protein